MLPKIATESQPGMPIFFASLIFLRSKPAVPDIEVERAFEKVKRVVLENFVSLNSGLIQSFAVC